MRRTLTSLFVALGALVSSAGAQPPDLYETHPVYLVRNVQSGEFVYTADRSEIAGLEWARTHERSGPVFHTFRRQAPGTIPLMRYVRGDGTHFLATSPQPARYEGVVGFVYAQPQPGT